MIKKLDNLILGITSDITKSAVITVLKDSHNQIIPIGTPGIVDFDSLKISKENAKLVGNDYSIKVSFPFPIRADMCPHTSSNIKHSDITQFMHKQQPGLFIKTVDSLNTVDLVTSVRPNNIKCFRYNNISDSIGLFEKIDKLKQEFKYYSVLDLQYHNHAEYVNELYTGYVTVFDIPTVIPIFDARKVDGVAINITLIYNSNSYASHRVLSRFNLSILFTNFRENIFEIDGCTVITQRTLPENIDKKYRNIIKTCVEENLKHKNFKREKKSLIENSKKEPSINLDQGVVQNHSYAQRNLPKFEFITTDTAFGSEATSNTSASADYTTTSVNLPI